MIDTSAQLIKFRDYLSQVSGVRALFGPIDHSASALPVWDITLSENHSAFVFNELVSDFQVNVKCSLIADKKDQIDALRDVYNTLKEINQFSVETGSRLNADEGDRVEINTEYDDNNIIISFDYRVKTLQQGT